MKFKLGSKWLEDRTYVTKMIQRTIAETGDDDRFLVRLDKEHVIFEEGEELNNVYILLEGSVKLYKRKPQTGTDFLVLELTPGAIIGIVAYTTGQPSLTKAVTAEPSSLLKIPEHEIRELLKGNEKISEFIDELILANLLERFRETIILQIKLDSLNQQLQAERNEVKQAYNELKAMQDQLIYQEKMSTLGMLVAGFAHEVNNPAAALLRSTETLVKRLNGLMDWQDDGSERMAAARKCYEAGKKTGYPDTQTIREKTKSLEKRFAMARKQQLRLLAQFPDDVVELLEQIKPENDESLNFYLNYFEMGKMLQNIESAGNRISGMVQSLKSYSRSDSDQAWEMIDIREGIHDTLQLTSNRIKYYDIEIDLEEIPLTRANPAALNQVWTNIILNAADAMGKTGSLEIRCNNDDKHIWVTIQDSGPGIKEEHLEKIFESSYSTKKSDVKFGLGLGLSICKDIVEKHGGTITAKNSQKGGAIFTVTLPVKSG
jgi:signal transduction histidine kinase